MRAWLAPGRYRDLASVRSLAGRLGSKVLRWLGRGKQSVGGIGGRQQAS
jgi:hypothetical protein